MPARRCKLQEWDEGNGLHKFNPLLDWTSDDVWAYVKQNNVPYNALHDRGYPSIGCAPCTRAVEPGQDIRAGRWWWEDTGAKECGLHVGPRKGDVEVMSENWSHLQALEAESIYIIREVVAQFRNPVLLYSIGKDSSVLVHLARKAFYPGPIPFPLLHVDTGYKFPEMLKFRDEFTKAIGARLIVHRNEEAIAEGAHPLKLGVARCCGALKTGALLEALEKYQFDAAIGGARRDEERSRAKERVFSLRDAFGQWDPRNQRPELWNLYNGEIHEGESMRVFPLSNWTETRRLAVHPGTEHSDRSALLRAAATGRLPRHQLDSDRSIRRMCAKAKRRSPNGCDSARWAACPAPAPSNPKRTTIEEIVAEAGASQRAASAKPASSITAPTRWKTRNGRDTFERWTSSVSSPPAASTTANPH